MAQEFIGMVFTEMKKDYRRILALMLALALTICMAGCSKSEEGTEPAAGETGTEEAAQPEEEEQESLKVIKTIEGIDEDLKMREPLMIESITLYEDGSVAVIPTEDLRKNEITDDADAVYPFEESGKVSDIYVVDYGNAGYRTILALLDDGTISAVNGRALVEDHIFAVMDDVGNKDNFVSVENVQDESAFGIVGITEDGDEVILDNSLNFDEPQQ